MKSVAELEPGVLFGKYCILRELGRGSMGVVHLAEDTKLRRQVALKILSGALSRDPGFRQRFELEARSIAALAHPNIVRVHAYDSLDDLLAIEMELVEGGSLADVMETKGLTVGEVARISYQVLEALACCHEEGLVHRDIKPTNILLDRHRSAKLTDFGLAKILEGHLEVSMRGTGSSAFFMGTPRYAPPEAWDAAEATPVWDLYSLGMVMYQAVTGNTPYEASTPMALVKEMATRRVTPLEEAAPHVSPEFARLVDRMIDHDPGRRPESAREAMRCLLETREMEAPVDMRAPTIVVRKDRSGSTIGSFVKKARGIRLRAYQGFLAGVLISLAATAWLLSGTEVSRETPQDPAPVSSPTSLSVETQQTRIWNVIPAVDTLPSLTKGDAEASHVYDVWMQNENNTYKGALLARTREDSIRAYAAFDGTIWGLRLVPDSNTLRVDGEWAGYEGDTGGGLAMGAIHGQARWLVPDASLLMSLEFTDDRANSKRHETVSLTKTSPSQTDTQFLLQFEAMPLQQPLLYNELVPRRAEWAMELDSLLPALAGARTRVPRLNADSGSIEVDGILDEDLWTQRFVDESGTIGILNGMPGRVEARMLVRADDTGLYVGIRVPVEQPARHGIDLAICKRFSLPESMTRWWRMSYDADTGMVADTLVAGRVRPWSCTWQLAAKETDDTWEVELYIPYGNLGDGEAPMAGERWRFNCVVRNDDNPASPTPRVVWGYPELANVRHGVILDF